MDGGAKGSFTCLDRCSKLVTVYKRWGLLRDWPRARNKAPVTVETCKKDEEVRVKRSSGIVVHEGVVSEKCSRGP
ncbi:hypothetical protein NC651_038089 [Populus alba x Populus x berolinensis]|nr:hypothetical protein NC651_038089 [Populus alba x Populus x berolinensis]